MGRYRKKPIIVSAYQVAEAIDIITPEGTMRANAGDWVITGVKGEMYPCKPDIFAMTYEPVATRGYLGSTPDGGVDDADRDVEPGDTGAFPVTAEEHRLTEQHS